MKTMKTYIFWETCARTKTYYKGRGVNVQQAFRDMNERRGFYHDSWNKERKYWDYEIKD